MIVRIRSRDGLERVSVPDTTTSAPTVSTLKTLIESQLGVPSHAQTLSLDPNLLLLHATNQQTLTLANPNSTLSSLGVSHGSIVYLAYDCPRSVGPPAAPVTPAGSFGRKMTMDDLIAKQVRVSRQETGKCSSVSFDRDAANCFQMYVNGTLAFSVKRGGFMYGRVKEDGAVEVDFVYEPPQQGSEDALLLLRDADEEALVEAIADGLGMKRVGFVFSQAVGREGKGEYTLSAREVIQATELHAEGGIEEWVTAVVKLEVNEDGAADVHFEAFQMSDICVKLFKDGWFVTDVAEGDDPKVSRFKKDVVVGVKDVKEVDNDFFLVPVKISDHQGPLSSSFPVENRITTVTVKALKDHLNRNKHLPFVKRISDFHLLLLLARYLDVHSDVPMLAMCVQLQTAVSEGYQLLIESLAAAG
ncbi:NPL4-like protein 2 [Iris pallida]|uniref:NPL4-like protein 2 n=1 Tax=Iris pallida TaxID=29817 RepID=A0AAX6DL79_IRIPA|nr:NPL4-like protein 2 [Iris pallida]KAJ6814486.1 NPL4-like protein 2 [Iris pallida]KAJ6817433.1 NPL4-like protein 2 [Iris pallida]